MARPSPSSVACLRSSAYRTRRDRSLYEHRARRASRGGVGYIDALVSGTALFEMKSRGKDFVTAENQALDYMESLAQFERPRYVITSDFAPFRVLDLGVEDTDTAVTTFPLVTVSSRSTPSAHLDRAATQPLRRLPRLSSGRTGIRESARAGAGLAPPRDGPPWSCRELRRPWCGRTCQDRERQARGHA